MDVQGGYMRKIMTEIVATNVVAGDRSCQNFYCLNFSKGWGSECMLVLILIIFLCTGH